MHFAYVNGARVPPAPGLKGVCGVCGTTLIAHCGDYKIWHWHHKSRRGCDPWWEPETQWHRDWKNIFPADQQEVIHHAESGEKHIADVRTSAGKVFEFQHSILKKEELESRESYYGDALIWIVDGLRSDFDAVRFSLGLGGLWPDFSVRWHSTSKLWHRWAAAKRPVFFDFGSSMLWRLDSFDSSQKIARLKAFEKRGFIQHAGASPTEEALAQVSRVYQVGSNRR